MSAAAFGVVIAAAFAVSGRRQLVAVGQLSANGASRQTIARFSILQGALAGVAGVVLGIVVGRIVWVRIASPWSVSQSAWLPLGDAFVI